MGLFKGRPTKIAAIQFDVLQDDKEANLKTAMALVDQACENEANFVCLPSAFATGINFPSVKSMAEPLDGPIVSALQAKAREKGVVLIGGLLERAHGNVYDTAVLVDASGSILGRYRRTSIWEGERDFITGGTGGHVIDTELGRVGLLISYDIRFPEACRSYYKEGVDIIVCVASLFDKYSFAVESLCRARAADNTCCLVLASSIGSSRLAMMEYLGGSLIVDGTLIGVQANRERDILARAGTKEATIFAEIHTRMLNKVIKQLPFKQDYLATWDGMKLSNREKNRHV